MSRLALWILASCAIIGLAVAQTAEGSRAPGNILKLTKWMLTVSDLERSFAFYHDAFGFEINAPMQIRKAAPGNAAILKLTNSPEGTLFRNITTHSSGLDWYLELLEFANPDRRPLQFRLQDPGATFLRLQVRDIDKVVAAALKNGGSINSADGRVMTIGKSKAVMLKDPDGSFLEVTQPDVIPATAPADGMLLGGNFVAVVKDIDGALNFYKQLGLESQIVDWNRNEIFMKMFGTPGAQIRRGSIFVPGTKLELEFMQFKGIDSDPMRLGLADPGTGSIGLQVRDIEAAAAAFAAHGGGVETQGGITWRPNGSGASFVRDLNGFLVELNQVAPSPASAVR